MLTVKLLHFNQPHFSFDGPENKNVNQQILAGVQSTDGVTPVSTIKGNDCSVFFSFSCMEPYELIDTVPFLMQFSLITIKRKKK